MFEYEFENTMFTQEQIDSRAKEKGLSTEQYLTNNPSINKIEVEKTLDVATQDAPVASEVDMASSSEDTSSESQPKFFYDPEAFLKDTEQVEVPEINSNFTVENDRLVEGDDPFPLVTEAEEVRVEQNKQIKDQAKELFVDFKKNNTELLKLVQFEDGFDATINFDDEENVKKLHNTLHLDFYSKNKEFKNLVTEIEKQNQDVLLEKQQEIADKYEYNYTYDEESGMMVGKLSEEDLQAATQEYNEFFYDIIFKNNRVQEIHRTFKEQVDKLLVTDNNRYTVDKHTPDVIKNIDLLSKTQGANLPYFSAYKMLSSMYTSAKSFSLATRSEGLYSPLYKHYRYISRIAEFQNWTDDTEGYVNDDGFFAVDKGPASGFRTKTTWGEARLSLEKTINKHQEKYTKDLNEILTERDIQSAFQTASFTKMVSGDHSLKQLKMMVAEQIPIMVSAVLSFGTIPAMTEGAQVYETLINQEARKLNPNFDSLSEEEKIKLLYQVAMSDDGSLYAKAGTSGLIIGQLERVGAKAVLMPSLAQTSESIIRGQYKNYLKNTYRKGVSGSFSEALTEGLQTFTSSAFTGEWHGKEFVEAIGMGGTIGLFLPVSANVVKQTVRELNTAYRMTIGKLDSKSSEAFFNNQLLQLDKAFKNKKINEQDYKEKRDLVVNLKKSNTNIPRNFTEQGKKEVLDILTEKQKLQNQKSQLDPNLTEGVDAEIDVQNQKLQEVSAREKEIKDAGKRGIKVGELRQEKFDNYFKVTTEMALEIEKKTGRKVTIEKSSNQDIASMLVESGEFSTFEQAIEQVDGTKGFRHGLIATDKNGNSHIILNEESSIATGKVTTAAHEFLHAVLFQTLKRNTKAQMEFGSQVILAINEAGGVNPNSQFARRLSTYTQEQGLGEEVATLLSESMLLGDVKFNESLFTNIKDVFRRFLLKYTNKEFKFDKSQDFYNFLKDYNKSLTDKKLRGKILSVAIEGAKGKLVTPVEQAEQGVLESREVVSPEAKQYLEVDLDNKSLVDIVNSRQSTQEQIFGGVEALVEKNWPVISKSLKFNPTGDISIDAVKEAVSEQMLGIFPQVTLPTGQKISREGKKLLQNYNQQQEVTTFLDATLRNRQAEIFTRARSIDSDTKSEGLEAAEGTAQEQVSVEEVIKRTEGVVLGKRFEMVDRASKLISPFYQENRSKIINLSNTPMLLTDLVSEISGIPVKKLKNQANLNQHLAPAQLAANKYAQTLLEMLPKQHTTKQVKVGKKSNGEPLYETRPDKSTKVPQKILDFFYNKGTRKDNLTPYTLKRGLKESDIIEFAGVVDGTRSKDENRYYQQNLLGLWRLLDRVWSNQELRIEGDKQGESLQTLEQLREGNRNILYAKDVVSEADLNKMLRKENKAWNSVVAAAPQNVKPIDIINNDADLQGYKDFVKDILAPNFPIEFFTVGTFAGAGTSGRKRNFAFLSQKEVQDIVEGASFAVSDPDITAAVSSVGKYGKLTGKTVAEKLKDSRYHKASRRGAKKIWLKIQEIMQAQPETIPYFAQMFKSTSQNMNHFGRVSSTLEFTNTLNEKNVEEHTLPASDFAKFLFNRALQGNLDLYIDGAFENYAQGSLPLSYDKLLKGEVNGVKFNFTQRPPLEFHLDILLGIKSKWLRYFNPLVNNNKGGINPNFLINSRGETIAEEFGLGVQPSLHSDKLIVNFQQDLLYKLLNGNITESVAKKDLSDYLENTNIVKRDQEVAIMSSKSIENARNITPNTESQGMSTFDFDETLIIEGKNFVTATKDGQTEQIPSDKWPIDGPKYAAEGWSFDFSDFANVRGGKDGPLLQKMKNQIKKYGPNNVFVLTARMQEAAEPIHQWLKSKGISIPIENITGLGRSEGEAKAEWMLQKYSEGYNDMYFVDDALPNVEAVQNVFDQLDIKGKSVQAKIQFSKDIDSEFNQMLERTKGIGAEKTFSRVEAQKRGKNKGKFTLFIPPSAEDFTGLLRYFAGTGAQGDADIKFFEEALVKPFARADREMSKMKETIRDDYKALRKKQPKVAKKLGKLIGDSGFTFDNAIRVYLFDKAGYEIPGLSKSAKAELIRTVKADSDLVAFADNLSAISKQKEGYVEPDENWNVSNIAQDLQNVVNKVSRKQFLAEWKSNVEVIFSEKNLNKIEAVYGSDFKSALQDILYRMESGQNRRRGATRFENQWNNWINNSVGAIMFFNARSAVLQTISTVNFINYEDNNIFAAGKAFANQKQYWSDFAMLFNSDFLKNRRAGLATNVNEAELASAVAGARNKAKAALGYLLKIGFTPTQIADSFAIASGGSTFYRNRVKRYVKSGLSQAEAESQAMLDFREIAEETQQSARPDRISQQQASNLGRIILAFANTPMQYNRLIKKAAGDLINRRGDWKANMSRILYYGAVQNFIFASLQNALFAMAFDDEGDDEKEEMKQTRVLNSMLDSLLRGSGIGGAALATVKNAILEYMEQSEKGGRADYNEVVLEALQVSPPIGSKARKLSSAGKTIKYNKEVMERMDLLDYNNPVWTAVGNTVEATTNIPMARAIRKMDNLREAMNQDNTNMQRLFLTLGWSSWDLNVGERVIRNPGRQNEYVVFLDKKRKAIQDAKDEIKQEKKEERAKQREEKKKNQQRCTAIKSDGERCKMMIDKPKKRCHYHD